MKYTGSCHCGKIRFEAERILDQAMACNCSMRSTCAAWKTRTPSRWRSCISTAGRC